MALRKGKIQPDSRLHTPGAYTFASVFLKTTLRSLVSNWTASWTERTGWCSTQPSQLTKAGPRRVVGGLGRQVHSFTAERALASAHFPQSGRSAPLPPSSGTAPSFLQPATTVNY